MLTLTIFLPLATGVLVLFLPGARLQRGAALAGSVATLGLSLALLAGYDAEAGGLQWRNTVPWISTIGASYDVAIDGLSAPLVALTAVLLVATMVYVLPRREDRPGPHAFLFLLMATGLIGLFSAQDLLLFYLFFEVGLVPMYFIIGMWGHGARRYAAMKFFLYTRAGSLAMLLAILALYLGTEPRTFGLEEIARQGPYAGAGLASALVLFGLGLGFGIKVPIVPVHNWLPDAHVEAPTEGSVMLAGIQLKMGGYGLLRVMIPAMPDAVREWAWVLAVLALASIVYGALAALAQQDFKRLVAYTSINHMGYVVLGVAVWGLSSDPAVRQLALTGATYQMVSHGLLTGGMFFLAGMLRQRTGTRDLARLRGIGRRIPWLAFVLGVLAFGSLGLPGFSGFVGEFQVLGAAVSTSLAAALITVLGLVVTTGLYLRIVSTLLLDDEVEARPEAADLDLREAIAAGGLAALSLLLGVLPGLLVAVIAPAAERLSGIGL